jgi:hypothetical protein
MIEQNSEIEKMLFSDPTSHAGLRHSVFGARPPFTIATDGARVRGEEH